MRLSRFVLLALVLVEVEAEVCLPLASQKASLDLEATLTLRVEQKPEHVQNYYLEMLSEQGLLLEKATLRLGKEVEVVMRC